MSDLHAAIMNIECRDSALHLPNARDAYAKGHRDARHAAAELALASDARIAELEAQVEKGRNIVRNDMHRAGQYQARIDALEAENARWVNRADKTWNDDVSMRRIAELEAALLEAQKDADRWRWLRQQSWYTWQRLGLGYSLQHLHLVKSKLGKDLEIDAAINELLKD